MRLDQQRPVRRLALAASVAATAMALVLACATSVGLAADYQDSKGNVCEGN